MTSGTSWGKRTDARRAVPPATGREPLRGLPYDALRALPRGMLPDVVAAPDSRLVAAAFGLGEARGPARFAARGELGRVYRLETSTGAYAVKTTFEPWEEAEAARNAAFQDAAAAAGVPLPRPVRTLAGALLAEGVRVHEWVELDPAGRPVDPADAGRVLAAAHAVGWAAGPVEPWFREPVGAETLEAVAAELRASGVVEDGALAALLRELVDAEEVVRRGVHEPAELCHRDVNPDNLLRRADGRPVLLDWDNAGPASPRQELASVLYEQAGDDPDAAWRLHAAYVEAGGRCGVAVDDFAMAFAVQAQLFVFYGRRFLDGPASENGERAARRLVDMAARPLSLGRAEALSRCT